MGGFAVQPIFTSTDNGFVRIRVLDIDGDGDLDPIGFISQPPRGFFVAENLGGGAFTTTHYLSGTTALDVAVWDVNGDATPDLAVMAFDNAGASWLQRGTTINNPYFGASMLRCGEVRAAFPPLGVGGVPMPLPGTPEGHDHE